MKALKKAAFQVSLENHKVRCTLCPHGCELSEGETGKCRVRGNRGGVLYAFTYGKVAAVAADPIEKKPLYHFKPGSQILSIGGIGCNFNCPFCQNWHLVEGTVPLEDLPPEKLVQLVENSGTIGISYTYNEPLIWFEYIMDTAPSIKEKGFDVTLVTNGFINPKPFKELVPFVDAMNVDVKSAHEEYLKRVCDGGLKPVLRTIEIAMNHEVLVEATHLMVTDETDSEEETRTLARLLSSISDKIPLHISRYFPQRLYTHPPTPPERLLRGYEAAREFLHYVYLGNIFIDGTEDTLCPQCKNILVHRVGYSVRITGITTDGRCASCNRKADVVI